MINITISDGDIDEFENESQKYFKHRIEFDDVRREAIKGFDDIQACPGSGKTTLVVTKLIIVAKKWRSNHQGICVLSHTNVAKNEIVNRLKNHPDGSNLLRPPHFIGTIQEFVNRFLGLPYCRYKGWPVNYIDNSRCVSFIERKMTYAIKAARENMQYPPKLSQLLYKYNEESNGFEIELPIFRTQSRKTQTAEDFKSIKKELVETEGGYFYSEMYEFAKAYLKLVTNCPKDLQNRFPYIFIDEMQDVDLVQDSILKEILYEPEVIVQRFGDPDQAIYRNSENSNQSFNDKNKLLSVIGRSHRFTESIAKLVTPISFNKLQLTGNAEKKLRHTIFLVDNENRYRAIPAFAELCIGEDVDYSNHAIKAVGSIGKEIDNKGQIRIVNYWEDFNRSNSTINEFSHDYFISYFFHIKNIFKRTKDFSLAYDAFLKAFEVLLKQTKKEITIEDGSLILKTKEIKTYLKKIRKEIIFNTTLLILLERDMNESVWQKFVFIWTSLFKIDAKKNNFFQYVEKDEDDITTCNKYKRIFNEREIEIDIGTIHSVKGETHSATLVLETKKNRFTFEDIMDLLLGLEDKRPDQKNKISLMKETYVGMSRPKYLLCLACNKDIFYNEKNGEIRREKALRLGWNFIDLTTT